MEVESPVSNIQDVLINCWDTETAHGKIDGTRGSFPDWDRIKPFSRYLVVQVHLHCPLAPCFPRYQAQLEHHALY